MPVIFIIALVLAFLLGAIPFAYIFVKKIKGVDIRKQGSGNVGATNAARALGKPMGILVLLLDIAKGAAAAGLLPLLLGLLAKTSPGAEYESFRDSLGIEAVQLLLGIAAFIGHCFSPFLGFKGGKGVATALGVYLVVSWQATLLTAIVCILIIVITRLVSLASLTGAVLLPVSMVVFDLVYRRSLNWSVLAITVFISLVVVFRHRKNISRLMAGKENRV